MSKQFIHLIDFSESEAADLAVQLGSQLPSAPIETLPAARIAEIPAGSLILLRDSHTAPAVVRRIFEREAEANIAVLARHPNGERGEDLIDLGVIDYRQMPPPDEAIAAWLRQCGHRNALSSQAAERRKGGDIFVTHDLHTRRLLDQVALIAPSNASVLVVGESGTGKERLSQYIHHCSNRRDGAFIAINCAAIPEGVLESELFGHEKGAFTGATSARPGKFELAHEGTILLDEITEMPLHLQAKLLRVLQEGQVDRLGGRRPVDIDVRVIATSNRDIAKTVAEGQFRQDLYFRLNVVTIRLPGLRARPSDIAPLADHFLDRFATMYGRKPPRLSAAAAQRLLTYPWPGNVRELENCMHRAYLMSLGGEVGIEHLGLEEGLLAAAATPAGESGEAGEALHAGMSIRDMERALIEKTLDHVRGNRTEAAKLLGISIRTLRNKLREYQGGTGFADDIGEDGDD